ncbi:MAG: hypothetical protein K0B11_22530 [Mariniphaga sp.]|nr:hypothetical protein [Mariniphaga sp.]
MAPDIVIIQKDLNATPGRPERKSGFLPAEMYGCKYRQNLNISNKWCSVDSENMNR